MNKEEYINLVTQIKTLIVNSFDTAESMDNLSTMYPKLVVMYEFVRLLRGEAFTDMRPPVDDFQKNMYELEDSLRLRLEALRYKLIDDKSAQYSYQKFFEAFSL